MAKILFYHVSGLTMKEDKSVITDGFVVVEQGKIKSVGETRPEGSFEREIDCTGKIMLPGLVNAHTHIPMVLLRGMGGGNNLQDWLNNYIFPAEARLDGKAVTIGTQLALADLLSVGVTSIADMYYFSEEMAQVIADVGMNANISRGITCFQEVEDMDAVAALTAIEETEALVKKWHNYNEGQIKIDLSIHGEYTSFMAPKLWDYMGNLSVKENLPLHIHISETKSEHEECKARHGGKTPIQVLDDHGLWERGGLAAHCVWTEACDWEIMAKKSISAVHNPVSNLKLGSGIAPIADMRKAGVNIALGTDSVASNNNHDLLEEVKLTAMLHNGVALDPLKITSYEALEMATRLGGKALQRPTGVIAEGYDADIILLDVTGVSMTPCFDMVENTVYSAKGSDVSFTMCRGNVLYEGGLLTTINLPQVLNDVKEYAVPRILGKTIS